MGAQHTSLTIHVRYVTIIYKLDMLVIIKHELNVSIPPKNIFIFTASNLCIQTTLTLYNVIIKVK